MPIVGPIVTGVNTTSDALGCVIFVYPSADEPRWWHSKIFVTSLSNYSSKGVPDLTTVYTYPTQCVDRWMISPPCYLGLSTSITHNVTVFSVDPARLDTDTIVSDLCIGRASATRHQSTARVYVLVDIRLQKSLPIHPMSQLELAEHSSRQLIAECAVTPIV